MQKKVFLEISQSSQENTCARVTFLIKLQASGFQLFLKKTLVQMFFSCEHGEISKNTSFTEHLCTTASAQSMFGGKLFLRNIDFI